MATVTELTYDIDIEFPISKQYIPIQIIRGDDVTLRFTQPVSEDWTTSSYNVTIYDESTRATLGSTPFNSSTTTLVIDNYNFDTDKALVVLEGRMGTSSNPTGTMTVLTQSSEVNEIVRITYDGVSVDAPVTTGQSTTVIAESIRDTVNNSTLIGITATTVANVITFTAKLEGITDNGKVVTFSDPNTTLITVDSSPTLSGGVDRKVSTYKTIAHINFVVFDGGNTILTYQGFVEVTQEDDTVVAVPYFATGFEVG